MIQRFHKGIKTCGKLFTSTKEEWKGFYALDGVLGSSSATGAFKTCLPDVFVSATHFKRALRNLETVKLDEKMKNARNQNRKFAAQTLDALMKGLTKPISELLSSYRKTFKILHPFEATVADLTVIARVKRGRPDLKVQYIFRHFYQQPILSFIMIPL